MSQTYDSDVHWMLKLAANEDARLKNELEEIRQLANDFKENNKRLSIQIISLEQQLDNALQLSNQLKDKIAEYETEAKDIVVKFKQEIDPKQELKKCINCKNVLYNGIGFPVCDKEEECIPNNESKFKPITMPITSDEQEKAYEQEDLHYKIDLAICNLREEDKGDYRKAINNVMEIVKEEQKPKSKELHICPKYETCERKDDCVHATKLHLKRTDCKSNHNGECPECVPYEQQEDSIIRSQLAEAIPSESGITIRLLNKTDTEQKHKVIMQPTRRALTSEQAQHAYNMVVMGNARITDMAKKFNCNGGTIANIISGISYKEIVRKD